MPSSPWDKPPTGIDNLGPDVAEYMRHLHETVFGIGLGGKGSLDANNLGIDYKGNTTRSGKSPLLVADATTGRLQTTSAGFPVGDLDVDGDGILLGAGGAGAVATKEQASPFISHRLTADYNAQEHFPVDDEVKYDYEAAYIADRDKTPQPEGNIKAAETTWSTKRIQDYIRDPTASPTIEVIGDVVGSNGNEKSLLLTLTPRTVTFAKMQAATKTSLLIGKGEFVGDDSFEEIELGSGLTMIDKTLNVSPSVIGDHGTLIGLTDVEDHPQYSTWPAAGIPNSAGSSWGTSYTTTGTGTVVALQDSPSFTTPIIGDASGSSVYVYKQTSVIDKYAYRGICEAISGTGVNASGGIFHAFVGGSTGSSSAIGVTGVGVGDSGSGAVVCGASVQAYVSGGTFDKAVSLLIGAPTGATENWAMQSVGGQSYHVGNLRIGSTVAPDAALAVTGTAKISTSLDVPKLANLTTNGFVKTSGGDGTLSIDSTLSVSGSNTGDVTLAGSLDYITLVGQVLTRNAIDLAADVTGTLPSGNGGMTYPGAGIPKSTGSAWDTSYTTTGTGTVVALQTSPAFTTPSLGVATGTSLDLSGHAAIGAAATVAADSVLGISELSGGVTTFYGNNTDITREHGTTVAVGNIINADATGTTLGDVYGSYISAGPRATGATVSTVYGQTILPYVFAGSTATNAYGLSISMGAVDGTVTNSAAISIGDASTSSATNKWAIASNGGQSYHVGNLRIGSTTAPTVALDVTGAALVSSTLGVTGAVTLTVPLAVASGGTGSTTAADARTALGLAIGTNVQAYDAELAALSTVTSAADALPYFTGAGTASTTTLTTAARTVLDDTTVGAMVTTLGGAAAIGTAGTGLTYSASPTFTGTVTAPTLAADAINLSSGDKISFNDGSVAAGSEYSMFRNGSNALEWRIAYSGIFAANWAMAPSTGGVSPFGPVTAGAGSIGSSTVGINAVYFDESGAGTETVGLVAPVLAGSTTVTLPAATSTLTGQAAALTSTRVAFADANGLLTDDADLTFSGATLTTTGLVVGTTKISSYNGIGTVSNGVPSLLGQINGAARTTTLGDTTVYTPAATGFFRVNFYLERTTAATTSSSLTPVIKFTGGDSNVGQTLTLAANTTNSATTGSYGGSITIYARTSVAITFAVTYASSGATPMAYTYRAIVEAL